MAETFWCGGERVKFSSGAVEILFRHLVQLAGARRETPGMRDVGALLADRLERYGDGGRAFGMDPDERPTALADAQIRQALLEVLDVTLRDVTAIQAIDWHPELAASWRERLVRLHAALAKDAA